MNLTVLANLPVTLSSVLTLTLTLPPRSPSRLQVADLYCSACECALCEDCVSDHDDHPKVELIQALEQHRGSLQERLGAAQNR